MYFSFFFLWLYNNIWLCYTLPSSYSRWAFSLIFVSYWIINRDYKCIRNKTLKLFLLPLIGIYLLIQLTWTYRTLYLGLFKNLVPVFSEQVCWDPEPSLLIITLGKLRLSFSRSAHPGWRLPLFHLSKCTLSCRGRYPQCIETILMLRILAPLCGLYVSN